MTDNGSQKFKIRFDDEGPFDAKGPEPPLQETVENLRLNNLGRRINLFAVLIPCLMALILLFVYFDFRKKFDNISISGSTDVQALSKSLDSKFSSLSIRQAKLEALLNEKISAMEKAIARLEKNLEKTEKVLSGVRTSTPDKEEIAGLIADIDKTLAPIHTDIKKLSSEIKKISSETKSQQDKFDKESGRLATSVSALQKEIAAFQKEIAAFQKDIAALKTDTAALASGRVDKKTFDLAVRHLEERYIPQKVADLEKSLSEKIEALRNQIKALEEKQKKTAAAATPSARPPTMSAPPPVKSIKPAIPEPGKIIEQEIKR